jgi:FkbM family methyltransferase
MLIPLKDLIKKYNCKPKGVLHLGANYGQEAVDYEAAGAKHVWWVEAIPDVFIKMRDSMEKFNFETITCTNNCLSDVDGEEVEFKISNNEGQSSSFLDFGTHSVAHPTVKFVKSLRLKTKRFDTLAKELVEEGLVNMNHYDFLNIDLQGAELLALKGMGRYLKGFKWLYIEVNKAELYKGCPMVEEIDTFLKDFERVEIKLTTWGWGDAFYIKK